MTNLWLWFDGKKVIIGSALLFAAVFFQQVIIGQWHVEADWIPKLIASLNWGGMAFTGTGLIHKGIKQAKAE